jgi:hypothetical protein
MVEPMGIRYYAYPVAAELAELAAASPHDLIGSDPFFDAWGPVDRRPHMLYLDKAWRNLQAVFGPSDSGGTCPAFELVRGEVTMRTTAGIRSSATWTPTRLARSQQTSPMLTSATS